MEYKDKIIAELDRRLLYIRSLKIDSDYYNAQIIAYGELLDFINSLPLKPASEDLAEVVEEYTKDDTLKPWRSLCKTTFRAGARWDREQFLAKAEKWFMEHINISQEVDANENGEPLADSYIKYAKARIEAANEMFESFKKGMEE